MRKSLALLATGAVAASGALAASADGAKTKRIAVGDNYFVRDSSGVPKVSVRKGTRVKWVWRGDSTHNVRVTRGPVKFQSKFISSGSFTKRMRRKGTYTLVCDIHGAKDQSMKLVVR